MNNGIETPSGTIFLPDECIPFIRWQRSRYSDTKVPDPEEVKRRYAGHVSEDFEGMLPYLPKTVGSIIEVGCGVGTLSMLLKRRFPNATLGLLDGDGSNVVGGYASRSTPYNSRKHTEMLLDANGVKHDRWYDIETPERLEADLIVSLASWGYHYPLSTYRARGYAIIDLRRGREAFRGQLVFRGPKYDRCAFKIDQG